MHALSGRTIDKYATVDRRLRLDNDLDAVLDIALPVMSDHELGAALRARLGPSAPRSIALSGYGQEQDREKSLQCGFSTHIAKLASLAELLQVIGAG